MYISFKRSHQSYIRFPFEKQTLRNYVCVSPVWWVKSALTSCWQARMKHIDHRFSQVAYYEWFLRRGGSCVGSVLERRRGWFKWPAFWSLPRALSMSVVPSAWASVGALREFPIKTAIAKSVAYVSLNPVLCWALIQPLFSVVPGRKDLTEGTLVYGSYWSFQDVSNRRGAPYNGKRLQGKRPTSVLYPTRPAFDLPFMIFEY